MIFRDDIDYDRTRARQERRAMEAATDLAARHAHQVLAERYADRAVARQKAHARSEGAG